MSSWCTSLIISRVRASCIPFMPAADADARGHESPAAASIHAGAWFAFLYKLLWTLLCVSLSLLLRRPVAGHTLQIAQIALFPLTIADVHLRLPASRHALSPSTSLHFALLALTWSLPSPSSPTLLTTNLHRALLTTPLCSVSTALLTARLRILPVAWAASAGPPLHAALHDFRLRVFRSAATPRAVQRLRDAVVGTVLFGECLRLDGFKTTVCFGSSFVYSPAPIPLGPATVQDKNEKKNEDEEEEDLLVTARAETLHMHDGKGRVYAFDEVTACMRRTWGAGGPSEDRGTYEMEAQGARWMRLPPFVLPVRPTRMQVVASWLCAPVHLAYLLLADPLRLVDLAVPAAHIRFDAFRMRDAALVRRGFEVLARAFVSERRAGG
ncbi:hypothetical protein DENSPDRAFT_662278 [Dentipellis sp. KUC8613]|nr:hypothetical protein DENSPDRAFT_662278 [Dentipellis sp. KUC8613]